MRRLGSDTLLVGWELALGAEEIFIFNIYYPFTFRESERALPSRVICFMTRTWQRFPVQCYFANVSNRLVMTQRTLRTVRLSQTASSVPSLSAVLAAAQRGFELFNPRLENSRSGRGITNDGLTFAVDLNL